MSRAMQFDKCEIRRLLYHPKCLYRVKSLIRHISGKEVNPLFKTGESLRKEGWKQLWKSHSSKLRIKGKCHNSNSRASGEQLIDQPGKEASQLSFSYGSEKPSKNQLGKGRRQVREIKNWSRDKKNSFLCILWKYSSGIAFYFLLSYDDAAFFLVVKAKGQ